MQPAQNKEATSTEVTLCVAFELYGPNWTMADAQIAAICRTLDGARLATRNSRDFDGLGLDLANPWTDR